MATVKKKKSAQAARPTVKKSVVSKKRNGFWRVEFNINTVYWMIIGLAVIATAVWTYNTNQQISEIYDSIDYSTMQSDPAEATVPPSSSAY